MATYIVYRCPQCKADVGRRFGLYTKLNIVCPNCRANVRIGPDVIRHNWGYNFGLVGGLVVWLILGVGVLLDPDLAKMIARNTTSPMDTFDQRLLLAGMMALPGFLGGLLTGIVGIVLGSIVASGAWKDEETTPPSWPSAGRVPGPTLESGGPRFPGSPPLQTMGAARAPLPVPAPASPPQPPGRNVLVRIFFVLLWPVLAFAGGVIVLAMVAMSTAKPEAPPPTAAASTVGLIAAPAGQGPLVAAASLIPPEAREEARREGASKDVGGKVGPLAPARHACGFRPGVRGLVAPHRLGEKAAGEAAAGRGKAHGTGAVVGLALRLREPALRAGAARAAETPRPRPRVFRAALARRVLLRRRADGGGAGRRLLGGERGRAEAHLQAVGRGECPVDHARLAAPFRGGLPGISAGHGGEEEEAGVRCRIARRRVAAPPTMLIDGRRFHTG